MSNILGGNGKMPPEPRQGAQLTVTCFKCGESLAAEMRQGMMNASELGLITGTNSIPVVQLRVQMCKPCSNAIDYEADKRVRKEFEEAEDKTVEEEPDGQPDDQQENHDFAQDDLPEREDEYPE